MRVAAIAVSMGLVISAAVACGRGDVEQVEEAVAVAADVQLAELGDGTSGLRVVSVGCQRTTPIQDDVDQYFCDIAVEDDRGAGFVDRDSEVFYSTSSGTAELLTFPPRFAR